MNKEKNLETSIKFGQWYEFKNQVIKILRFNDKQIRIDRYFLGRDKTSKFVYLAKKEEYIDRSAWQLSEDNAIDKKRAKRILYAMNKKSVKINKVVIGSIVN